MQVFAARYRAGSEVEQTACLAVLLPKCAWSLSAMRKQRLSGRCNEALTWNYGSARVAGRLAFAAPDTITTAAFSLSNALPV